MYEVRDYAGAKDDVGFRVEITEDVGEEAKTIAVKSVKRLSAMAADVFRPEEATLLKTPCGP